MMVEAMTGSVCAFCSQGPYTEGLGVKYHATLTEMAQEDGQVGR